MTTADYHIVELHRIINGITNDQTELGDQKKVSDSLNYLTMGLVLLEKASSKEESNEYGRR